MESWVSAYLLRRPLLSILYEVYIFVGNGDWDLARRLSNACLQELSFMTYLAPLMIRSLTTETSARVDTMDGCMSSGRGRGVRHFECR